MGGVELAEALEFVIGAEVRYSDGAVCGEVERVVVDPAARTVTIWSCV
jgi:hypothetical protein